MPQAQLGRSDYFRLSTVAGVHPQIIWDYGERNRGSPSSSPNLLFASGGGRPARGWHAQGCAIVWTARLAKHYRPASRERAVRSSGVKTPHDVN